MKTRHTNREASEQIAATELNLAVERIGRTAAKRLAWAFRFAQQDLNSLSAGDLLNLRLEITVFRSPELATMFASPKKGMMIPAPNALLFNRDELKAAQGRFMSVLKALQEKRKFIHFARLGIELDFANDGQTSMTISGGDQSGSAVYRFAELLAKDSSGALRKIRRCSDADCNRFFFGPKNKKFCSKTCLSRATTRRSRQEKGRTK